MSPFRIVISFVLICSFCAFAIPGLKINLEPQENSAELTVEFFMPNSSPMEVEHQATAPLENTFSQLLQLKKITSQSFYNRGTIQLVFDDDVAIDVKRFELASLIRNVYTHLPKSVTYPQILEGYVTHNKSSPLLVYSIYAPFTPLEIKDNVEETIQRRLNTIPGIKDIIISGATGAQLTIEFDETILKAYNITVANIKKSIENQTTAVFPGSVAVENKYRLFVKVLPSLNSDVGNIFVTNEFGAVYKLKDLARVYLEEVPPDSHFRINGKPSITLRIYRQQSENALKLAGQIKQSMSSVKSQLPAGYEVDLEYDDSDFFAKELSKNFQRMLVSILVLALSMLTLFRGWRYLLILISCLVVNLSLVIIISSFLNISIHLYSLAGISISFGLMIDHAIIVLDYYRQFGNRRVVFPLMASTFTIIASLCLFLLLPEEDQKNLSDFFTIMSISILTSLCTSVILIPGIFRLLYKEHPSSNKTHLIKNLRRQVAFFKSYFGVIAFVSRFRILFAVLLILLFGIPIFLLPSTLANQEWYNRTFGSSFYQLSIRPVANRFLGGSLRLFVQNAIVNGNYRNFAKTKVYVRAEFPFGNTLDNADYVATSIEQYLSGWTGLDKYVTQVSEQRTFVEISFLNEYENSQLPERLKNKLIEWSLEWGGIEWTIYGVGQGFSNGTKSEVPSFNIYMRGYNFDELERQAKILGSQLKLNTRIRNINVDASISFEEKQGTELRLSFDNWSVVQSKLNRTEAIENLRELSLPSNAEYSVAIAEDVYPMVIKEKGAFEFSKWDLLNHHLGPKGNFKMSANSALNLEPTASVIHREDRQYIRVVSCDYYGPHVFGQEFISQEVVNASKKLPKGYYAELPQGGWNVEKLKHQYYIILLLLAANFVICAVLFENLKQPFLVIATIPISFIGLFLSFGLGEFYFDQGGYAAFIMLGGLVTNAAIFIVNDYNSRLIKSGRNANRIFLKTTVNRSRTIFLTTIATICGLIPFIVEGQKEVFWFALAIGTIGGLLAALFAIFIAVPVWFWKRKK